MAPPTPSPMPNTRSTPATLQHIPKSTPHHSKHRLHFPGPNPKAPPGAAPSPAADHPVEVIGRIRDHPADSLKDKDKNTASSVLEIAEEGRSVRVCTDVGYRDFALDGVSVSGQEDLEAFYRRFVASRAEGVRSGAKCTIMMYGPTGSGKSHTMFGCPKQPGIVYRALRDILRHGGGSDGDGDRGTLGIGTNAPFVQVAVLEIYNEEIYDLLSGASNGGCGGPNLSLSKGSTAPKVRLEVMGKKAKNASYISGNEAAKITKEVAKVEKRRIVRSTHCNERSSRSHCMIILDVPSVGGRLMLVDMAGSENIEAAGQASLEAKIQTAKINQGNVALKRVVESIANGDSHVPFRDSKLTMLLQDSFEDDKSKILMILCASPDPKETHKTLSTFEYGAKAKCIVRVAHMPALKEKVDSEESSIILKSQIIAMNKYIYKLQTENKVKERERGEEKKKLLQKEEELVQLRTKLQLIEGKDSEVTEEELVNLMVDQKSKTLRLELKRMEERMLQQQEELNFLRQRLEELQLEGSTTSKTSLQDKHGRICMKRQESCAGDHAVVKSMELDMGDVHNCYVVKEIREDSCLPESYQKPSLLDPCLLTNEEETDANILRFPDRVCLRADEEEETDTNVLRFPDRVCLSTVFEEDEEDEEDEEENAEVGVDKEVVEVNHGSRVHGLTSLVDPALRGDADRADCGNDSLKRKVLLDTSATDNTRDALSARKTRIQNIFRLCGNHRELARQVKTSSPLKSVSLDENRQQSSPLALGEAFGTNLGLQTEQPQPTTNCKLLSESRAEESPVSSLLESFASFKLSDEQKSDEQELLRCVSSELPKDSKENHNPCQAGSDGFVEVHVKWEASKEFSGSLIKKLKLSKNSSLSDLRKLIEIDLEEDKKFSFLLFGDPSGTPIAKEKEVATQLHELPICNHQLNCRLACLRPVKKVDQKPDHVPFGSLENTLNSVLHL